MRFCEICQNMLYLTEEENNLKLYCKNCNFSTIEKSNDENNITIATKKLGIDKLNFKSYMTPNIVYDVTLPRVNNIKCPSVDCKPEQNEVIYVKYDHDNMKYLYCCCNCRTFWRSS